MVKPENVQSDGHIARWKNENSFRFLFSSCRKMATGNTEEKAGGEH